MKKLFGSSVTMVFVLLNIIGALFLIENFDLLVTVYTETEQATRDFWQR